LDELSFVWHAKLLKIFLIACELTLFLYIMHKVELSGFSYFACFIQSIKYLYYYYE